MRPADLGQQSRESPGKTEAFYGRSSAKQSPMKFTEIGGEMCGLTHGTCRLTLTINGASYAVRPVPCHPTAAQRCWSLRKSDGTVYHASQHPWGAECDCPDFVFHRDGRDPAGCKHLK